MIIPFSGLRSRNTAYVDTSNPRGPFNGIATPDYPREITLKS